MADVSTKSHLKRRNITKSKRVDDTNVNKKNAKSLTTPSTTSNFRVQHTKELFSAICKLTGIICLIIAARYVVWYLEMLHENLFWFSHIKEVEKEISFRTEQGLYYSFYKQLIQSPNLSQGLHELQNDNITEHGRTINILHRFNIYQEVFLATVYKYFDLQRYILPIMFYTKFVFVLQAFLAAGLYFTAWTLSRSYLAGILTLCLFIAHKNDASRVDYSVPLRECFSLPFVFCQMAAVTYFLKPRLRYLDKAFYVFLIFVLTFVYTLTWQFAQFISLIQSACLFLLALVGHVSTRKVLTILYLHLIVMCAVWLMQLENYMLLTSLLVSFIPFAILSLYLKTVTGPKGILKNIVYTILFVFLTAVLCFLFNQVLKIVFSENSDVHIFKFVKGKLGLEDCRDFESRVYLCNEAFNFLDVETYRRLSASTLFPFYCVTLFFLLSHLAYRTLVVWDNSQKDVGVDNEAKEFSPLAYHAVQSILYAIVGSSTRRMVCLWVPHMCIIASVGVTSSFLWKSLGSWFSKYNHVLRRLAAALLIIYFLNKIIPFINEQVEDLNEFWDPDTVELMEWIQSKTPSAAAFAGSMQLMAGVKLCTGRPITNHPHFENSELRRRTVQLYQMYAKLPPEHVHKILTDVGASYIILEDSLCIPSDPSHCHIIDIMDLHNGHVPEHGAGGREGLVESKHLRFCDEIRSGDLKYLRYFKVAFVNKTFRVYKVLR